MDLRQIRYLVAVADAGSFSAGARRAFITQPTLSVAIAALETELGVKLFERRARGTVPTPEGSRVLIHARAMLREAETMKTWRKGAAPRPLRLGLLPTLPQQLVAATLTRIALLDPSQPWRTEDAPVEALRQRLANGRYDAIITRLGKAERGHRQITLAEDRQALAFARGERPRGPITPRVLDARPLIVRSHCEFLEAASRILDDWHVRPQVIARTDSDARALAMVAAGLGACLMPDSFQHDGVVFVRPDGVNLPRRLGLEWIGTGRSWLDRQEGLREHLVQSVR
jgi:LysR family hydrogen peroxide-inducible transcriptional activator